MSGRTLDELLDEVRELRVEGKPSNALGVIYNMISWGHGGTSLFLEGIQAARESKDLAAEEFMALRAAKKESRSELPDELKDAEPYQILFAEAVRSIDHNSPDVALNIIETVLKLEPNDEFSERCRIAYNHLYEHKDDLSRSKADQLVFEYRCKDGIANFDPFDQRVQDLHEVQQQIVEQNMIDFTNSGGNVEKGIKAGFNYAKYAQSFGLARTDRYARMVHDVQDFIRMHRSDAAEELLAKFERISGIPTAPGPDDTQVGDLYPGLSPEDASAVRADYQQVSAAASDSGDWPSEEFQAASMVAYEDERSDSDDPFEDGDPFAEVNTDYAGDPALHTEGALVTSNGEDAPAAGDPDLNPFESSQRHSTRGVFPEQEPSGASAGAVGETTSDLLDTGNVVDHFADAGEEPETTETTGRLMSRVHLVEQLGQDAAPDDVQDDAGALGAGGGFEPGTPIESFDDMAFGDAGGASYGASAGTPPEMTVGRDEGGSYLELDGASPPPVVEELEVEEPDASETAEELTLQQMVVHAHENGEDVFGSDDAARRAAELHSSGDAIGLDDSAFGPEDFGIEIDSDYVDNIIESFLNHKREGNVDEALQVVYSCAELTKKEQVAGNLQLNNILGNDVRSFIESEFEEEERKEIYARIKRIQSNEETYQLPVDMNAFNFDVEDDTPSTSATTQDMPSVSDPAGSGDELYEAGAAQGAAFDQLEDEDVATLALNGRLTDGRALAGRLVERTLDDAPGAPGGPTTDDFATTAEGATQTGAVGGELSDAEVPTLEATMAASHGDVDKSLDEGPGPAFVPGDDSVTYEDISGLIQNDNLAEAVAEFKAMDENAMGYSKIYNQLLTKLWGRPDVESREQILEVIAYGEKDDEKRENMLAKEQKELLDKLHYVFRTSRKKDKDVALAAVKDLAMYAREFGLEDSDMYKKGMNAGERLISVMYSTKKGLFGRELTEEGQKHLDELFGRVELPEVESTDLIEQANHAGVELGKAVDDVESGSDPAIPTAEQVTVEATSETAAAKYVDSVRKELSTGSGFVEGLQRSPGVEVFGAEAHEGGTRVVRRDGTRMDVVEEKPAERRKRGLFRSLIDIVMTPATMGDARQTKSGFLNDYVRMMNRARRELSDREEAHVDLNAYGPYVRFEYDGDVHLLLPRKHIKDCMTDADKDRMGDSLKRIPDVVDFAHNGPILLDGLVAHDLKKTEVAHKMTGHVRSLGGTAALSLLDFAYQVGDNGMQKKLVDYVLHVEPEARISWLFACVVGKNKTVARSRVLDEVMSSLFDQDVVDGFPRSFDADRIKDAFADQYQKLREEIKDCFIDGEGAGYGRAFAAYKIRIPESMKYKYNT